MLNIFKKPEPQKPKCIFCNKNTEDETLNELKYEALDENGALTEYIFGLMCDRCSDILDQSDEFTDMSEDHLGKKSS